MPKLEKVITLEIRPEQYLNSCSALELQELELLIQSPRYQNKMRSQRSVPTMDGIQSIIQSQKGQSKILPNKIENWEDKDVAAWIEYFDKNTK